VIYAVHSSALTAAADRIVHLKSGKVVSVESQTAPVLNAAAELRH